MAKIGEKEWSDLLDKLVELYPQGDLIPHYKLEKLFLLSQPNYHEFDSQDDFLQAVRLLQFEYMTLIDKLRWDILEKHKLYLRNIRGDGYTFLPTSEQTEYAKKQTMDGIKKEMKRGLLILQNIKRNKLTADQRRKNSDELAKLGQLKQIMDSLK
jgi:hypothetical protein